MTVSDSAAARLLAMLGEKDPETLAHCRRVAVVAAMLAKGMATGGARTLPPALRHLRQAALLHDIGKLAIPTAILRKPGRLSDAEYETIKTHAVLGGEMVAAQLGDDRLAEVVRHHHEWLDGTGYPDGLRGTEIGIGARICAVADAFDVVRGGRPYCRRKNLVQAVAEMERHAGTRYDPEVIVALVRGAEEIDRRLYVATAGRRPRRQGTASARGTLHRRSGMDRQPAHPMTALLQSCLAIDAMGHAAYAKFARHCPEPDLARAWRGLAQEEKRHVAFWRKALALAEHGELPDIFENPETARTPLDNQAGKIRQALDALRDPGDASETLAIAYRLEAFMLDPTFMAMYRFFGVVDARMEQGYEAHIGILAAMLRDHGAKGGAPHLGLLGEALCNLHRQNRELARQGATDPLTGLLNRTGFLNRACALASLARRTGAKVAVIMADIDDFKRINDRLGHPVGDRVIAAVAGIVAASIRKSDVAGRHGGEEFIAFLNLPRDGSPNPVCRRIVQTVERTSPDVAGVPVTISVGAAMGPICEAEETGLAKLIRRADDHLLAAKRAGKNRWLADQD
jgi:diguanylate cyclase (GGDEF)-like protein/putative nucleotidyltransferase with HDIG domain